MTRSPLSLLLLAPLAAASPGCPPAADCDTAGNVCSVAGTGSYGLDDEPQAVLASLYKPIDVIAQPGADGAFFISDWNNHRIRRVDAEGVISTAIGTEFLGDGDQNFEERTAPGVPGTTAALNHPTSAEWNPVTGRLLVPSWHNHRIREFNPETGNSVVVCANTAGDDGNGANAGFAGDGGPCADVLMAFPASIVVDETGDFFLWAQRNRRVRKITGDFSMVTTVAGTGALGYEGDDGPPLAATFNDWDAADGQPEPAGAIERGDDGLIYLADTGNHVIRVIDLAGDEITTLGGTGTQTKTGSGADVGGDCATDALCSPRDVELGPDGRLYVADAYNHVVRAIDLATGEMTVVAGTLGVSADGEDGVPATESALFRPYGIDFADDGALLIADTFNSRIRRVAP